MVVRVVSRINCASPSTSRSFPHQERRNHHQYYSQTQKNEGGVPPSFLLFILLGLALVLLGLGLGLGNAVWHLLSILVLHTDHLVALPTGVAVVRVHCLLVGNTLVCVIAR